MKPLLGTVVALWLVVASLAHPENIEEVKELPQDKEPIIEAEESAPQARAERCTTCSGNLQLNAPNEIFGAFKAAPGAVVHTQSFSEECSSEKGCAGIKVKDGQVVERFNNDAAFKAAASSDFSKEYTFHPVGAFSGVFDAKIPKDGPFWWMNEGSPFKAGTGGGQTYSSKSGSFSSTSGGGSTGPGFNAALDLGSNPFLNGGFKAGFGAGSSGFQAQQGFNAAQTNFGSKGYVGSSPSPFTASPTGSSVNLIQTSQKQSEVDFEQQAIDSAFAGSGNVRPHENSGELQQTCAGQGYVCVHKAQCNNGVVNTNGAGVLQAKTKKQYCNLKTEICCRIEVSTIGGAGGLQGSLGVGGATYAGGAGQQSGGGLFVTANGGSSQSGFNAAGSSGSNFGAGTGAGSSGSGQSGSSFESSSSSFESSSSFGTRGQSGAGFGQNGQNSGSTGFGQGSQGSASTGFGQGSQNSGSFGAGASQTGFGSTGSGSKGVTVETSSFESSSSRGSFGDNKFGTTGNAGTNGNKFGATGSSSFGSKFGNTGSSTTGFGSTGSGTNFNGAGSTFNGNSDNKNEVTYKKTQTNFVETDSFSSGSDNSNAYRPGVLGGKGPQYLPPVDNTNSGSNVIPTSRPPPAPRPTPPRPVRPTTSAPGYLPPVEGQQSINQETILPGPRPNNPNYDEGSIILDENRFPNRPKPPPRPVGPTSRPLPPPTGPIELPGGCAAALKCTPIEYCTAEGVISNTTVALTRDQEAYRVPLTDCKDIESGTVGKCCRDPYYTDPWPTNQLGKWVPGVFGGNDGKYTPDSRPSQNIQRPASVRPPGTGSLLLNNYRTEKPTTPFGPNQVSTVTQGQYQQGQYSKGEQGQYSKGGVGQYTVGGQGQYSKGGQGQYAVGGQGQFGQVGKGVETDTFVQTSSFKEEDIITNQRGGALGTNQRAGADQLGVNRGGGQFSVKTEEDRFVVTQKSGGEAFATNQREIDQFTTRQKGIGQAATGQREIDQKKFVAEEQFATSQRGAAGKAAGTATRRGGPGQRAPGVAGLAATSQAGGVGKFSTSQSNFEEKITSNERVAGVNQGNNQRRVGNGGQRQFAGAGNQFDASQAGGVGEVVITEKKFEEEFSTSQRGVGETLGSNINQRRGGAGNRQFGAGAGGRFGSASQAGGVGQFVATERKIEEEFVTSQRDVGENINQRRAGAGQFEAGAGQFGAGNAGQAGGVGQFVATERKIEEEFSTRQRVIGEINISGVNQRQAGAGQRQFGARGGVAASQAGGVGQFVATERKIEEEFSTSQRGVGGNINQRRASAGQFGAGNAGQAEGVGQFVATERKIEEEFSTSQRGGAGIGESFGGVNQRRGGGASGQAGGVGQFVATERKIEEEFSTSQRGGTGQSQFGAGAGEQFGGAGGSTFKEFEKKIEEEFSTNQREGVGQQFGAGVGGQFGGAGVGTFKEFEKKIEEEFSTSQRGGLGASQFGAGVGGQFGAGQGASTFQEFEKKIEEEFVTNQRGIGGNINKGRGGAGQFGAGAGGQFAAGQGGVGQFVATERKIEEEFSTMQRGGAGQKQFVAGTGGQFAAGQGGSTFKEFETKVEEEFVTNQRGIGESFGSNVNQRRGGAGVGGQRQFGSGVEDQFISTSERKVEEEFVTGQRQGSGVKRGAGQGVSQGQGFGVSQGQGFGVSQGQGSIVSKGQGQIVSQGQGQAVTQGQGQGVSQGQGQVTSQGQGFGVSQGQGFGVSQGQGFGISQGQGQGVSQGQGQGISRGQGQGVSQGKGQVTSQGQGFGVSRGQGFGVSQGQGFTVQQGQGQYSVQGQGQGVRQGVGSTGVQGQGQGVIQGQGQGVSQGFGSSVSQGGGFSVSQGGGSGVSQGGGFGVSQGGGFGVSQGSGFGVSQGGGFGEYDGGESVQRVFLQRFNLANQCGIENPQKPLGNHNEQEVDFAEIPWQAMVLLQTNKSLLCGGIITRPDVVVTTASCVEGLQAKNVLIKGGEWKLGVDDEPLPFQIVQVKTILRHPQYKSGQAHFDAAILVLSENLRLAKNIWPICLPSANDKLDAFYNGAGECIVTGWGKQVLQAHLKGALMHGLNVSLINPGECQNKLQTDYPHLLENYDQESCACGLPTNPVHNMCKVDIGSALACTTDGSHYVLRGVYSWDSGCQPGNQLAAFYKFDVEWYEWAIGLLESQRYGQYSSTQVTQNKYSGQIKGSGTGGVKGQGNQFGVGIGGGLGGIKGGFQAGQFGSGQVGFNNGFGQVVKQVTEQTNQGLGNLVSNLGFNSAIKAPSSSSNSFSSSSYEKKYYQTEPKYVTYTTKPEYVTFTTKPEIYTYTTKPKIFSYTTKPEIVTFTTKPEYFSYTTKPQVITYETSGSATNPQYVAPGVTYNPSFSQLVSQHKHDASCQCLDGKK